MLRTPGQATQARARGRRPVTAATGTHCPVSGVWAPVGEERALFRVLEGSVMPAFRNAAAEWKLLEGLQRRDIHT
jgi:hypothetical protein